MSRRKVEPAKNQNKLRITPELYSILVGLSIAAAINNLITNYSFPLLYRFIAFLLIIIVFYHGQLELAQPPWNSVRYKGDSWFEQLIHFYIDIGIIGSFLFQAFLINKFEYFFIVFAITIILDILTEICSIKSDREAIKINLRYIFINMLHLMSALIIYYYITAQNETFLSLIFLILVFIVTIIDYYINRDIYFIK